MTTNTNSAQERTASIDLEQLDDICQSWKTGVISGQSAMIDISGLVEVARRSLTSGATLAEQVPCRECKGTGSYVRAGDCSDCNGKGYHWEPIEAGAAAKTEQAEKPRNWAPNSPHNVCRQTEQNLRDDIYKLHAKLEAAAKTEQAYVSVGADDKLKALMEGWRAANTMQAASAAWRAIIVHIDARSQQATAAGAGSAQPEALEEPAPTDKPFAGPGAWFSVDVLGHPMRQYAPGKWENCKWPSSRDAEQEEASTQTVPDDSKHIESEAVSTMLWLYRRLHRCYGRLPNVERPIVALAKLAGFEMNFIAESFSERDTTKDAP